MDPSTAAIAGGAMQSAGDVLTNATNIYLARKQRDWSERMSNTAHQREVRDLMAAGLNPILSAGGGGAGQPQAPLPMLNNIGGGIGGSLSNAARLDMEQRKLDQELENLRAGEAESKARAGNIQADTAIKVLDAANYDSTKVQPAYASTSNQWAQAALTRAKEPYEKLIGDGVLVLRDILTGIRKQAGVQDRNYVEQFIEARRKAEEENEARKRQHGARGEWQLRQSQEGWRNPGRAIWDSLFPPRDVEQGAGIRDGGATSAQQLMKAH